MTIRYAISIVSAMHIGIRRSLKPPACFFASPERIIREVVRLGYDGVQIIPVWGLRILAWMVKYLLLSQGPWNAVWNLPQALRHEEGSLGVRSEVQDWVVSPPPDVCERIVREMNAAGIRRISHDLEWRRGQTIELHPGLDSSAEEIYEYCREFSARLVLDLHHLRRSYRRDELEDDRDPSQQAFRHEHFPSPLWKANEDAGEQEDEWQRVIRLLAPFIDVIHVQTWSRAGDEDPETPAKFAADPLNTETGMLLFYTLRQIREVDPERELILVAEYNPGIKSLLLPFLSRRLARKYLLAIKQVVAVATQRTAA